MKKKEDTELSSNRRAFYDYEILESFEAGIVLQGTEVKSLKNHGANLQDAYVLISDQRVILKNAFIAVYKFGNIFNHAEKRDRELLLHKQEIVRLAGLLQNKGLTIIPLSFYLRKGLIKVRIASARGKKNYDKRAELREKDAKRQMQQAVRHAHGRGED